MGGRDSVPCITKSSPLPQRRAFVSDRLAVASWFRVSCSLSTCSLRRLRWLPPSSHRPQDPFAVNNLERCDFPVRMTVLQVTDWAISINILQGLPQARLLMTNVNAIPLLLRPLSMATPLPRGEREYNAQVLLLQIFTFRQNQLNTSGRQNPIIR